MNDDSFQRKTMSDYYYSMDFGNSNQEKEPEYDIGKYLNIKDQNLLARYNSLLDDNTTTALELQSLPKTATNSYDSSTIDYNQNIELLTKQFIESPENHTQQQRQSDDENDFSEHFEYINQEEQNGDSTFEMTNFTSAENYVQANKQYICNVEAEIERSCIKVHPKTNSNKEKAKKSYDYKNVLKIFGQKIVSLILSGFYDKKKKKNSFCGNKKKDLIGRLLEAVQSEIIAENGAKVQKYVSPQDFKEWLKHKKIKKDYVKISSFRNFWKPNPKFEVFRDEAYKRLLTRITKRFLEQDVYNILIENKGPKPIKREEYIAGYIDKIPVLLHAMEDPEKFTHLD